MTGSPPPQPSLPGEGRSPAPRLSAFERVQLLLVLWIAASELLRGGFGVTILPQAPQREASDPLTPAAIILRIVAAAMYPAAAFFVSRRLPLWQRSGRHAAGHLGVLAGLHALAFATTLAQSHTQFSWMFYVHRTFEFVVYTVFAHGMLYGERYHAQEREELRLRTQMAGSTADRMRAQVRALRMEWSPRFLTGTLESIGELLARDVAAAKRLLLGLSSVLRRTLAHARMETVRLEQEVEFVREVLRVEALRRPGLAVEWALDDEALEMPVPHMSLVTMVYQALPDGDAAAPARLRISAVPEPSAVLLRVDAAGVPADGAGAADGIGERLGAVYGAGHTFQRAYAGPGEVRLELRCASDPPARDTAGALDTAPDPRPIDRRPARPAPADDQPAIGSRLEWGTYAAFMLFYTLLTLYTAQLQVNAGRVVLAAPAWVYVGGMGFYAALWWGSMALAARSLSNRYPIRRANWP
ncbi:MAG TPA: histidine kinase, partial [Longimicrobium sp.]|nr:histidine kinase [Longimicrobium sp.]